MLHFNNCEYHTHSHTHIQRQTHTFTHTLYIFVQETYSCFDSGRGGWSIVLRVLGRRARDIWARLRTLCSGNLCRRGLLLGQPGKQLSERSPSGSLSQHQRLPPDECSAVRHAHRVFFLRPYVDACLQPYTYFSIDSFLDTSSSSLSAPI